MRPVDLGLTAVHHDTIFIWTIDIARTQNRLPSVGDATRGREDAVVTVTLVEFWTFDRRLMGATIENHRAFVEQFRAVGAHAIDREDALYSGTAIGPCVDQVRVAVFVPERAGIDPSLRGFDQQRRCPWTSGIARLDHVDAKVGIAVENVKVVVVKTDRGGPDAVAVLRSCEDIRGRQALQRITDDLPVDQIS